MLAQSDGPRPQTSQPAQGRPEELALALRAISGDDTAFDGIVARFERPLYDFVCRYMGHAGDPDGARDLTQDALLKAWLGIRRGQLRPDKDGQIKISAWLYRIAQNVCLDALRHRKLIAWKSWAEYTGVFHPTQVAPDDPAREARDAETRRQVRAVLDAIPEVHDYGDAVAGRKWRDALILREWGDLTYAEIAAVQGTTLAAVKSRLLRARRAFREIWEQRYAS